MRKLWLIIVLTAAVILSACGQSTQMNYQDTTPAAPSRLDASTPIPTRTPVPTRNPAAVEMACEVVSVNPTQGPTETSMFPPVDENDWVMGSSSAALTITEYSDFQCPYCAFLAADLRELYEMHPDDIRVVFRHFPLPSHPLGLVTAYAAEAAGLQGKFWEMHDILFEEQGSYAGMTEEQFQEWLIEKTSELGLNQDQFVQDMHSERVTAKVQQAQQHGLNIGIPGTPLVLLNGQYYQGPRDVASLDAILGMFQLEDRQYTHCPEMEVEPQKEYIATIKTEKGNVVIHLFADKAPLAVNSFVFLSRQGWFNDTTFHRVLPGFVAQAGDPSGTGFGGPGYTFVDEITELIFDKPGMLAMANAGPGSNGSQFFITFQPIPDLNGKYTIFGEVIDGIEVLQNLSPRDPSQQMNLPPGDKILTVEIKEQ
jgi:cyclophilin family peptidyl-prolyl cis-trans isomerase/protein-disulfide isomerase